MDNKITLTTRIPPLLIFLLVFSGCQVLDETVHSDADFIPIDTPALTPMSTWAPVSEKSEEDELPAHGYDPWPLWTSGTHLRGANIYQRRVYTELDGPEFMGAGPLGPPYTQEDFNRLSALGANVVNISHPGLFTEIPPYTLDLAVQSNLDRLLEQIRQADMFAVIAFRTGPGRSEFTFLSDSVGDWFDASYLNDQIWIDQEAQEAWVAMWKHTAERYREAFRRLTGREIMGP